MTRRFNEFRDGAEEGPAQAARWGAGDATAAGI